MDTVTYPDPAVARYISEHFIPFRAVLNDRQYWPLFRANHVIWTPTVGFMDRNGSMHYQCVGFLPPDEFLSVLVIGLARVMMAWTRAGEAAVELKGAVARHNSFTPEALFWLGVARFLARRETSGMWEAWERLVLQYPHSPWARRVYPRTDGNSQ